MSEQDVLEGFTMLRNASSRPLVTVTPKLVTFSQLAIKDLGHVEFVHLFFNQDKRSFAVQACEEDLDAIPFVRSGQTGRQVMARWGDKAVVGPIVQMLGPDALKQGSVRVLGKTYEDKRLIIFNADGVLRTSRR